MLCALRSLDDRSSELAFSSLCSAAVKLLGADASWISVSKVDCYEVVESEGFEIDALPRVTSPTFNTERAVTIISDTTKHAGFGVTPICNGEVARLRTIASVPMKRDGVPFGGFCVGFNEANVEFWDEQRNAMFRFARLAAALILEEPVLYRKINSLQITSRPLLM